MALTPTMSREYTQYQSEPVEQVKSPDWDGKLSVSVGKLTFTAAGQGAAQMVLLPAGRKIIFPDLCRIICPQGATDADLHVGHGAYTDAESGDAVNADDNAFADNLDLGGAAIDAAFSLPAAAPFYLDSKEQVDITITIDTGDSAAAGDAYVVVVYGSLK
jgi:hypothetical protein